MTIRTTLIQKSIPGFVPSSPQRSPPSRRDRSNVTTEVAPIFEGTHRHRFQATATPSRLARTRPPSGNFGPNRYRCRSAPTQPPRHAALARPIQTRAEISAAEVWFSDNVRCSVRGWLCALVVFLGAATVPAAQSQTRTTAPSVYVNIKVTLDNSRVSVSRRFGPRGVAARFIVGNVGTKPIKFTVGDRSPTTGNLFGFSRSFKPGTKQILLLYLNYRGAIPYFVGQSFARAKSGERGVFTVGQTCGLCTR
jgi:hypothetical protein